MDFIVKKLQFLLDKINELLLALGRAFSKSSSQALDKVTPTNLKKLEDKITDYVHNRKNRPKPSEPLAKRLVAKVQQKIPVYKEKVVTQISSTIALLKAFEFKIIWDKFSAFIKRVIFPPLYKLRDKYNALSPKTVIISMTIMILIGIASLNFYMATKKIVDETSEKDIVKVIEVEPRPQYYKASARQVRLDNVKMPIYVQSAKDIKSLVMDFTLESSNRYIKKFFEKNPHYLQDKLNTTVEPIVPSFPLKQEGKRIIRDKLIDESNDLIKGLNIKGKVKKVYFHNITAS